MEEFKKNLEEFLPYLEDLRDRMYRGVLLFIVAFVAGFLLTGVILKRLLEFVHIEQVTISTSGPFQFIEVAMDFGFFFAIIITVPYIIYSFYIFITPALTKNERTQVLKSVPLCALLFIIGFLYGFFILNYALGVLAAINVSLGVANFWNVSQFLSQIFITSALLGLVFEFPLLLTLLIKLNIINSSILRSKRKVAYFLMLCLTAFLPPTDVVSLIAMTLPLMILYELTILLNNNNNHVWIRD